MVKRDLTKVLSTTKGNILDAFPLFYEELTSSLPTSRIRRLRPSIS